MADDTVSSSYLVETSILECVTSISLILSILLILSSMPRFAIQPVAISKRFFHCVVTVCCILNVVKSIDNQQVFDRFNSNNYIVIFLTNNITPCLMMGGAVLIFNTVDVQYRISKTTTPPLLMWLLAILSVANFVFINTCTALAVAEGKQLYYIYVLYYMVASFFVLLAIADVSVWQVRKVVVKYQDRISATVRSKALAAEKSLYPLYAFVIFLNVLLCLVIAALLYQANLIDADHKSDLPPDRADPTSWKIDTFAWVHCVAIFVFIWWSWVPLYVVRPVCKRLGYESHDETTRLGANEALAMHKSPDTNARGSIISTVPLANKSKEGGGPAQILVAARVSPQPSARRDSNRRDSGKMDHSLDGSLDANRLFVASTAHVQPHLTTTQLSARRTDLTIMPGSVSGGGGGLSGRGTTPAGGFSTIGHSPKIGAEGGEAHIGSGVSVTAHPPLSTLTAGSSLQSVLLPGAAEAPHHHHNRDDVAELSVSRENDSHTPPPLLGTSPNGSSSMNGTPKLAAQRQSAPMSPINESQR